MIQKSARDHSCGFTLIEVLVVLAIMGVVAAAAVFAVSAVSTNSVQDACKNDIRTVQAAADSYRSQTGQFPTAGQIGIPAGTTDAVPYLRTTYTSGSTTIGPWLHDDPSSAGHYSVQLSTDGAGTVTVTDSAGSGQTSCSAAS